MKRLEVNNLSYCYGSIKVLDSVNIESEAGKLICIIGPNGVGKSTLVKCIDRIIEPSSGTVMVDYSDMSTMKLKEVAQKIGFVPVASDGTFSIKVLDVVLLGRFPHQHPGSRNKDVEIAYDSLKKLGVENLAMRDFNQLSAGQKQRVAIAKGLAQEPELLILDEPTANLDLKHQVLVTQLLKDIAHKSSMMIIMISHDINIAARFADELIVMIPPGIIHSIGKPKDVLTESTIRKVYGMNCRIIDDDGKPHIILKDPIENEDNCICHL